jgi:chromosome segregation ATPase
MKSILLVILGIVSLGLAVTLFLTKQGDNAQRTTDGAAILDLSNELSTAQAQYAANSDTIITLSNSLAQAQSGSLAISNQLADAQSAVGRDADQIVSLKTQVAEIETTNRAVNQQATALAGQVTGLTQQLSLTQTNLASVNEALAQANDQYSLLENRFRINVAERAVMQRKFYNPNELQKQLDSLKHFPSVEVSDDMIYAGLDVEVRSNGTFHVIKPN